MWNSASPASEANPLISFLPKSKKFEALAAGFLLAQAAGSVVSKWRQRQAEKNTVVLKFQEGSDEYRWLCWWLAKLPRVESQTKGRVFTAKHLHADPYGLPVSSSSPPTTQNEWALIPDNFQGFMFEGMTINLDREEPKRGEFTSEVFRNIRMTCVTKDMAAVERLLVSIFEAGNTISQDRTPRVMAMSSWGEWVEIRKAPKNRIPVLPTGVMDSLIADAAWFIANESWYHSVGVPYRRGYLMHGIPGSGKTTTAICMAARLQRDVYLLPLSGLSDDRMTQGIRSAGRDGILLLEDIDCAAATNDRDSRSPTEQKDTLTLMGLLNAIDGAATPEGRILIGTTNRREVLEKALIRPGRFDREFEFKHADFHQITELCLRFGLTDQAEKVAEEWHAEKVSMAEVQKRLIEKCGLGFGCQ